MNLFEVLPQDLFSLLSSPNRVLYADALQVLFDAFKDSLKIPEDTLYSMMRGRLESALAVSSFDEEGIYEEEAADLSGRARFLIRRLKEKGWIDTENDGEKYIIVPSYSIHLLELFSALTNEKQISGFSYVYDTYTSLKSANEDTGCYEKMMALYGAAEKTRGLIKLCKLVYHNINRYFQSQLMINAANDILKTHFDKFLFDVIDAYIKPLKIKDSVPKYKVPIRRILDSWLVNDDIIDGIADTAVKDKRFGTYDECKSDIYRQLYFIKDSYECFEPEYLSEIDRKVRDYTRATAQKLEYLTNNDKTVRGNVIHLLKALSESTIGDELIEEIQSVFNICSQSFISEKSLSPFKITSELKRDNPIIIDDIPRDYSETLRDFTKMVNTPYSLPNVRKFVDELMAGRAYATSDEFDIGGDKDYILSLLAVVSGSDRDSFYKTRVLDGYIGKDGYTIPSVRFERKEVR